MKRLLFVFAAAALLSGCGRQRPDLLLISIDTTRADRLGAYGYAHGHTPNIDALAKRGFVFARHLTPAPVTLPAHSSILTGLFPPSHGARDNGLFRLDERNLTLAEVLAAEGYATAAFVGAYPLAARFGTNQGFEIYDDRFRERSWRERGIYFSERSAAEVVDAALAHLDQAENRPRFTFLHFFDPHQPQIPPQPWDRRFADRPYDGELAAVDEQIGRLFGELEKSGRKAKTVVALTADHGEGLGEHGELTHAILLHQATLHVPLILAGPQVPIGRTEEWTVATEVFATLLELLGVARPQTEQPVGRSLVPLIRNDGRPPAGWARFGAYFETLAPRTSQGWAQLAAVMKEDWRFVNAPRPELYDLDLDRHERFNRAAEKPEIVRSLAAELRQKLGELEVEKVGATVQEVDSETVERLAALGYLQVAPESLKAVDDLLAVEGLIDPKDRVADISLYSEAKSASVAGRWALAETLWSELLARTPENEGAYVSLAMIYGQAGDLGRAFATLDAGLAVRTDSVEIRRFKGELLIESNETQAGLDLLLALPADNVRATTWIGQALGRLGKKTDAEAWYQRGLALESKNSYLRLYLANSQAERGASTEAEQNFRRLIADSPYFGLGFYNYGKLLFDRGERAQAKAFFERSRELQPEHEPTQRALREVVE